MVNGALIKKVGGDNLLDDLLEDLLTELLSSDLLGMLGRHDDGINTKRDGSTAVVLVLDGNLGLRVRTEPWESTAPSGNSQSLVELVGKDDRERHELLSLIGGIAEHDTLITGTNILKRTVVETLGDIGGLLLNGDKDVAGLVVETLGRVVVANLLDGVTDDLLVVDHGLGGDLTEDHDHTRLRRGLAGNLGEGVHGKAGIEDSIGNLVANLVCDKRCKRQYESTTNSFCSA